LREQMSGPAIRVENIGKQYKLGLREKADRSFREVVTDCFTAPLRRLRHLSEKPADDTLFWALRDVDFEVQPGEVVGIIGRNGAGKSTLLKILSRITEPTTGQAVIRGRVRSLLEVGTGFHPELTGRENIYLNGAILGMKKAEIHRKFDEIVAFAEVDRFLDTPVKRYSSGMYVRLAFGVAAHLEPEILLVDEVLAVGDVQFQKRCLGKMRDVAISGRTIVFVSHNMAAVENFCNRCIVLDKGCVGFDGHTHDAVEHYMKAVLSKIVDVPIGQRTNRRGNGKLRVTRFHLEDSRGRTIQAARSGEDCTFVFGYECPDGQPKRNVVASFGIQDQMGRSLILHRTNFTWEDFDTVPARGEIRCTVPKFPLVAGTYYIGSFLESGAQVLDDAGIIAQFNVDSGDFFGTGCAGMPSHGPFLVDGRWSVSSVC